MRNLNGNAYGVHKLHNVMNSNGDGSILTQVFEISFTNPLQNIDKTDDVKWVFDAV